MDSTGASLSASARDLTEKREKRLSCRKEREREREPIVLPTANKKEEHYD